MYGFNCIDGFPLSRNMKRRIKTDKNEVATNGLCFLSADN